MLTIYFPDGTTAECNIDDPFFELWFKDMTALGRDIELRIRATREREGNVWLRKRTDCEQIAYLQGALFEAHARICQLEKDIESLIERNTIPHGWTPSVGSKFYKLYMSSSDRPYGWCDACKSFHVEPRTAYEHAILQCFAPYKGEPREYDAFGNERPRKRARKTNADPFRE